MEVVREECRKLVVGLLVLDAITLLVSAFFHAFTLPMVLGVLAGSILALLNFYFLGYFIHQSVQKEPGRAKAYMISGYLLRMALLAAILVLGFKLEHINGVGLVLPLLYPKLILYFDTWRGGRKKNGRT